MDSLSQINNHFKGFYSNFVADFQRPKAEVLKEIAVIEEKILKDTSRANGEDFGNFISVTDRLVARYLEEQNYKEGLELMDRVS